MITCILTYNSGECFASKGQLLNRVLPSLIEIVLKPVAAAVGKCIHKSVTCFTFLSPPPPTPPSPALVQGYDRHKKAVATKLAWCVVTVIVRNYGEFCVN
jgi:hypothetical protein